MRSSWEKRWGGVDRKAIEKSEFEKDSVLNF